MKTTIRAFFFLFVVHLLIPVVAFPSAMDDYKQGRDLVKSGKYAEAIEPLSNAINSNELDIIYLDRAFASRGKAYQNLKEYKKALEDINQCIKSTPYPWAIALRGDILENMGDNSAAIKDFETALRLDEKNHYIYLILAWMYATIDDDRIRSGHKAQWYMDRADKMSKEEADYIYDTRAAVYAENGNFDKAVELQKKAIELLLKHAKEQPEEKAWVMASLPEYNTRLSFYQMKTPYRQEKPEESDIVEVGDSSQGEEGLSEEASYIGVIKESTPGEFIIKTDSGIISSILIDEAEIDWYRFLSGKKIRVEGVHVPEMNNALNLNLFYDLEGWAITSPDFLKNNGITGKKVKSIYTVSGVINSFDPVPDSFGIHIQINGERYSYYGFDHPKSLNMLGILYKAAENKSNVTLKAYDSGEGNGKDIVGVRLQ